MIFVSALIPDLSDMNCIVGYNLSVKLSELTPLPRPPLPQGARGSKSVSKSPLYLRKEVNWMLWCSLATPEATRSLWDR